MKANLDQTQLLSQLQRMSALAKAGAAQGINPFSGVGETGQVGAGQFGQMFSQAVNTVNQYQMEASRAATQIESGDGGVSLVKAMIASQKASVAFEATVQVRNKVVSAYQDIMNMPI